MVLGYISPTLTPPPISLAEIFLQPISLNPHTRLDIIPSRNISDKFTIIRGLCRFLQPGLGSIPNDWKHLLRTETSQKSFLKTFCYNHKVTNKVKDFQNSLIKKFTSPFYLIKLVIVLNTNPNLFHGQTSLGTPYSESCYLG